MRHAVEHGPGDLLDEVDLPRHVTCPPGRHRHLPAVELEPEPIEDRALLGVADLEADQLPRALRAERDAGSLRQPVVDVGVARQLRPRQVDEEPAREDGRRLGRVRIDSLLPLVRPLRAEREALGRLQHADRLEVRSLEQHLARSLLDLGVEATHDRRERDRSLAVGDQQVGLEQLALRAVEGPQDLPRARATDDDPAARQLRPVERVERAPPHVHHVVRHVDDVRDRAHAGPVEARPQPLRRRADRDVSEGPADVARAAAEVLDRTSTSTAPLGCGSSGSGRRSSPSHSAATSRARPDQREEVDVGSSSA